LEHKKYYINNQSYEKEEYEIKKEEILKDKSGYETKYTQVENRGMNMGSTDITGSFNLFSNKVENGYMSYQTEGGRNLIMS
jgi:hypothetical protein